MAANSSIEWCHHTFNPWIGCTKVSTGCANCYAEAYDNRWRRTSAGWGKGKPRSLTSPEYWTKPLQWNRKAAGATERPRVFCASLADWLDHEVPTDWLFRLLKLISLTPNLDWLLLSKRPQDFYARLSLVEAGSSAGTNTPENTVAEELISQWLRGTPPPNAWIGTSLEDQTRADERLPALLKIPADIRFLSCEPLLGPVDLNIDGDLSDWCCPECQSHNVDPSIYTPDGMRFNCFNCKTYQEGEPNRKPLIHWVIVGGESGTKARPMSDRWALDLLDQCHEHSIPFLFKQWGEHNSDGERTGKKKAGRLLKEQEWNQFPRK
jgi:protein gp37